jgi:hypothetical protein
MPTATVDATELLEQLAAEVFGADTSSIQIVGLDGATQLVSDAVTDGIFGDGPFLSLAGGTMTGVGDVLMGYGAVVPEGGTIDSGSLTGIVGMQHQGGAIRQLFGISVDQRFTQTTTQGRTTDVDCTWFAGDTTITSASANFTWLDEGKYVFGPHAYIKSVLSPTQVVLERAAIRGSVVGFPPVSGANAITITDPLPGSPVNVQINHIIDNTSGWADGPVSTQSGFGLNANAGPRGYFNLEGQTLFTGGTNGGWAGTPILFQTSNQYVNNPGEALPGVGAGALFNISSQVIADGAAITYGPGALPYRMFVDNFNFVLRNTGAQIIAPDLKYTSFTTGFGMFGTDIFFGEYSHFWAEKPGLNADAKLSSQIGVKIDTLTEATSNVGIDLFGTDETIGESAVSTTSHAIVGSGTVTFTVAAGKNFKGGQVVTAAATTGTNLMHGTVYSYAGTALTLTITSSVGSGTFASWLINATTSVAGIRTNGTFILGYGLGAVAPQMALWNPVVKWAVAGNALFSSNVFDAQATYQNLGAVASVDLGAVTTFNAQNTYLSDSQSTTTGGTISEFWSRPTFDVLTTGLLSTALHTGFRSSMAVNTGAQVTARYGFRYEDVGGTAPSSVLAQFALSIPYLSGAAANIGISNSSTTAFPAPAVRTPTNFSTIIPDVTTLYLTGTTAVTLGGGIGPALCIAPGVAGEQRLKIVYLGTGALTFQDGLGIKLNGASPMLTQNQSIDLFWSAPLAAWIWPTASGAGAFIQTFTQTDDVSGNQGMPLHVQVNDIVDYPNKRVTSADGHTTNGSATVSSVSAGFHATDVNRAISGSGIPAGTSIIAVNPLLNQATMNQNANATGTTATFTIGGGLFGGPLTVLGFVGATYDGTHAYPEVMQGPRGMVQIDGLTEYHYDANGSQAPPIVQTANSWVNGPRSTAADMHLTNGSATVTSPTAKFDPLDNGAVLNVGGTDLGTLTYVNATTATLSVNFSGTTTTTATGAIWRKLNLPGAALFNNSPSWVARKVEIGGTYEFTVSAPGIQDGYGNPAGIYGFAEDQYFGAQDGGWLNMSVGTYASYADGGYINAAPNISTVTDFFLPAHKGWTLTSSKSGIPAGTTILSVTDSKNAVLSANVTATQTGAVLTVDPKGTDFVSVGFWSLPVWNGKVNMSARYDFYSSEAYISPDHNGVLPILDYHVAFYAQSMRRAKKNIALVANAPIVGYDVDSVYSSALFKDAGTSFGGAFISLQNAYTLDFPTASFGSLFQFSGTVRYRQNASLFGAGVMIQNVGTYKNNRRVSSADGHTTSTVTTITSATAKFTQGDVGATITGTGIPAATTIATYVNATTVTMSAAATATNTNTVFTIASNVSITSITGTSMEMTFVADGRPTTFSENIDYRSSPHWSILNGGTFAGTTGSTGFDSSLTLGAGVGIGSRSGIRIHDPALGAGASISTNFGIFIEDQTAGSILNYGIFSQAPTSLGGLTIDRTGNVAGTHNLVTVDGVRTPVTSTLGDFGVKYTSNSLGANFTIDRIRTTGGVALQGDIIGGIYFRAAGNSAGTSLLNVAMLRGILEQDASTASGHSGGRLEFITTPLNSTTLALAGIIDNAKSFHLAPTLDGTTQLVNASGVAFKADGSIWVAPSAYSAGQPTAAAATISAAGVFSGASIVASGLSSFGNASQLTITTAGNLSTTGRVTIGGVLVVQRRSTAISSTVATTDYLVEVTAAGATTQTFAATNIAGEMKVISNSGAGTVTVAAGAGKTNNGTTSIVGKGSARYVGDGSGNWAAA